MRPSRGASRPRHGTAHPLLRRARYAPEDEWVISLVGARLTPATRPLRVRLASLTLPYPPPRHCETAAHLRWRGFANLLRGEYFILR